MPQRIKQVGQWKIGDVVFKDDPRWSHKSSPTPAGFYIVSFSANKKMAHLTAGYGMEWYPVELLQEFGYKRYLLPDELKKYND